MNGKLAKKIRRAAENRTIGKPDRGIDTVTHRKKVVGKNKEVVEVNRYTFQHAEGTTRQYYQKLKKKVLSM